LSATTVRVDGAAVVLALRCQTTSVLEALPALDRDGDGALSTVELEQGQEALGAYVLAHDTVSVPAPASEGAWIPLAGTLASAALDASASGFGELPWVQVELRYRADQPLEALAVESLVFVEKNPWHRDFLEVVWNGEEPVRRLLEGTNRTFVSEAASRRRPGVLGFFVRLGIEHILTGYDHLAFLLALFVAARGWRALLGVVTAFTLAHSLTLGLVALDLGGVTAHVPARLVELAIALSIAYVGCENLLRRSAYDPWLEAFGFGLLHGLGFAGFLGDALAGEPLVVTALFGFNVGVELGQLAFVLLLALLVRLALRRRRRPAEEPALVPVAVRRVVSAAVAVAGFAWFLERAGWV
jgi:hypothetical protein